MLLKQKNGLSDLKFVHGLKDDEFFVFLNKFFGLLISKGKKGIAHKLYNEII
jgi:hypothetical protein